jgi:AcrR family transcriptional regulator
VTKSLSRRERKKLKTRQALFMAALSLFRGKGHAATTVEEITEKADVAKGTFCNYFPSCAPFTRRMTTGRRQRMLSR